MSAEKESKRPERPELQRGKSGVATQPLSPGLWLVATPIGNLGDITLRALDVLRLAHVLVCEDTRRTRQLMDLMDIPVAGRPMISYHDRNGAQRRPQIQTHLEAGRSVAYASDAGTPLIADPGFRLVQLANELDVAVHAAPGASAVIVALSLSGLPTDRFAFSGFLPARSGARRREAAELAGFAGTLVFFESPRRLADSLEDLADVLGPARQAVVARELTKTFEQIVRGTLTELAESFRATQAKGEIVVLVGPPERKAADAEAREMLDDALLEALSGDVSVKDASKEVSARLGLPRRDVYTRALDLTRRDSATED